MKRIAVIFDLDETIGYFGDVAVFIEAYEKYRNKSISDEELFIVFNTIPELFRKGIFDIFRLLRNFKKMQLRFSKKLWNQKKLQKKFYQL